MSMLYINDRTNQPVQLTELDDDDNIVALEEATNHCVVRFDTFCDYVYAIFTDTNPNEKPLESYTIKELFNLSCVLVLLDEDDYVHVHPSSEKWYAELLRLVTLIDVEFHRYTGIGVNNLAIDCRNPWALRHSVRKAISEFEPNFEYHFAGRSDGRIILTAWCFPNGSSNRLYLESDNDIEDIFELINDATGDPSDWGKFVDDLEYVVNEVFKFKEINDLVF